MNKVKIDIMKIELTNEEIAKVFALYPSQKFEERIGENIIGGGPAWHIVWQFMEDENQSLANYRLLLTPLPKMAAEHAIEAAKMYGHAPPRWDKNKLAEKMKCKLVEESKYLMGFYANIHQYLISKGYAVPLFFGIDHPANGKTAIQLGIAIDSTITQPA